MKVTISLQEYYDRESYKILSAVWNAKIKDAILRVRRMNKRAVKRIQRLEAVGLKKETRYNEILERHALKRG